MAIENQIQLRPRPADTGRHGSPPRSRAPSLDDPPRAHRRSVRDDREAHEALEPSRSPKRAVDGRPRRHGRRLRRDGAVALDAFAARDVAHARSIHELDELVDRANRQVFDEVLGYVNDPGALEWGMRQITVARCFERIGDNAVDIGEQTAFLVTGELREFTDASH